jgi:hypothetical protein
MFVFDIPFRPQQDETWAVTHPAGSCHRFCARHDAVRFAAKEAARLAGLEGKKVLLSIEGEDGRWRLFGPDLKAPTGS